MKHLLDILVIIIIISTIMYAKKIKTKHYIISTISTILSVIVTYAVSNTITQKVLEITKVKEIITKISSDVLYTTFYLLIIVLTFIIISKIIKTVLLRLFNKDQNKKNKILINTILSLTNSLVYVLFFTLVFVKLSISYEDTYTKKVIDHAGFSNIATLIEYNTLNTKLDYINELNNYVNNQYSKNIIAKLTKINDLVDTATSSLKEILPSDLKLEINELSNIEVISHLKSNDEFLKKVKSTLNESDDNQQLLEDINYLINICEVVEFIKPIKLPYDESIVSLFKDTKFKQTTNLADPTLFEDLVYLTNESQINEMIIESTFDVKTTDGYEDFIAYYTLQPVDYNLLDNQTGIKAVYSELLKNEISPANIVLSFYSNNIIELFINNNVDSTKYIIKDILNNETETNIFIEGLKYYISESALSQDEIISKLDLLDDSNKIICELLGGE